ncbi:hypothetical protein [Streptomyces zingiberis]|uniref:Uncharacterized protein n=1 Tax=Streptomyces zingiberis TaxID=2053010 RepID=A0ABX1BZ63_9ACTN|nr:hypothetical protein [Streptomyces zingiberis]NJQ01781.1 hypothetical protein [Streptomyces zingiberis]
MAASDQLNSPPLDDWRLPAWALARMGAALAEDTPFQARVVCTDDEGARTVEVGGSSARLREAEGGDPRVAALFDPALLIRDFATVSARHGSSIGRPCVVLDVVPHPAWADPESPWCPPGATSARLAVDTATGFVLEAATTRAGATISRGRVEHLAGPAPGPEGGGRFGIREGCPSGPNEAGDGAWALARMAATLLEPLDATARVTVHSEALGRVADDPEPVPAPGERRWTVTAERLGDGERTVTMGDDPDPHESRFVIARLAEMLTPARIVSHLRRVTVPPGSDGTTVTATVRPMRAFPMSCWAPDEDVECRFTVDPATGVLIDAVARLGDRELAHYGITSLSRR